MWTRLNGYIRVARSCRSGMRCQRTRRAANIPTRPTDTSPDASPPRRGPRGSQSGADTRPANTSANANPWPQQPRTRPLRPPSAAPTPAPAPAGSSRRSSSCKSSTPTGATRNAGGINEPPQESSEFIAAKFRSGFKPNRLCGPRC